MITGTKHVLKAKNLAINENTGLVKKRNLLELTYLKDGSFKLIVLLTCYLVLPYNSIEPNFSFL